MVGAKAAGTPSRSGKPNLGAAPTASKGVNVPVMSPEFGLKDFEAYTGPKQTRPPKIKQPTLQGFRVDSKGKARQLDQLLGKPLAPTAPAPKNKFSSRAQAISEDLRAQFGARWDEAVTSRGETAEQAADRVFKEYQNLQTKPKNPNKWFREQLFDRWRDRALRRIYGDTGLRQSLNKKASIVMGNNGKTITIGIKGTQNGKDVVIPLNVDHITGHAEAVKKALESGKASYLVETVAARYLQLLTGRENQAQIERLRDELREGKPTYLGKEVPLGDVLKHLP
jgi:hypothetical protein